MQNNFFTARTELELWEYLTPEQLHRAENDPFISSLPDNATRAVGLLIFEALTERGLSHNIPLVKFDQHFFIPKNPNPCGLTEDLKECSQYQTLPEHLTSLIEWMVD